MKRDLHALVLALLGGTLIKLAVTGEYTRYVRVEFKPYLIASGVVVLLVAVASLAVGIRTRYTVGTEPPADGHADAGHDHHHGGHHHGRFDVAWLLVAPLLVLLLLAPPALGTYSAGRAGSALGAATNTRLPPLPTGDPAKVSLLAYAAHAVHDNGASLTGRTVVLSGFVLPGPDGGWYLTRMLISCCAADAQPIKVGLAGTLPTNLSSNDWIEVTGVFDPKRDVDPVNKAVIPYLTATATRPIPAPTRPYES